MKKILTILPLSLTLFAQMPELKFSGYIDAYYSYDFNNPDTQKKQEFFFNHTRHNEFNVNLALFKMSIDEKKYRVNVALQGGTYANDNYPETYKNINEANAGISLNAQNNLWLDVGIFSSHLGFESAISMDNYTLTRSLAAESSPYFLTGAKLTYTPSTKLELALVLCNGWQVIEKEDPNTLPALGTQVIYKPDANTKLNWSTYIGEADELQRRVRLFNNLFGEFIVDEKLRFIAGLDIGALQRDKGGKSYDMWYIPSLLAKYTLDQKSALGFRAEYVYDTNGAAVSGNGYGMNTLGLSSNYDYYPQKNIAIRAEARVLFDQNNAYTDAHDKTLFITTSLAVKF